MGPHFLEYFGKTIKTTKPKRIAVGGMVPYLRFAKGAEPKRRFNISPLLARNFLALFMFLALVGASPLFTLPRRWASTRLIHRPGE